MQKIFKSVSLLLALLLLAPPVVASALCLQCTHAPEMEMSCCAGMHGMTMPMDDVAQQPDGNAQLAQAACCTETQVELTLPASPSDGKIFHLSTSVALISVIAPDITSATQYSVVKYPPGARPTRTSLSLLCTFLN
ncbi:MAG: hypothetical protein P4K83_03190 [Terracidiphilus sp.]|nr:hypothetical protein [Terracidiphilus sp.]